MAKPDDTASMALFCDFENVALGVRDAKYEKFDIRRVLERLLLKGSIVVKKAYCDWERYREFKAPMHEASFELIEIPHVRQSGKNSADIRMVVDALDLCYTKSHVDTFVIISGDSDFSPLVSKLRENNKTVIGVGVKGSTSDLLTANCDEFIFYDDLVREQRRRRAAKEPAREGAKDAAKDAVRDAAKEATRDAGRAARAAVPVADAEPAAAAAGAPAAADGAAAEGPKKRAPRRRKTAGAAGEATAPATAPKADAPPVAAKAAAPDAADGAPAEAQHVRSDDERRQDAIDLVIETVEALVTERGADDKLWGSMVKQAIKRRRPTFAESYHGYRSFNELLEDARDRGLLALERDEKSGGYVIRLS
jgi:uncharacterized protein (TIGR00288 family)